MYIIWLIEIRLKHMNKGYSLSCWGVAIVLTHDVASCDNLLGSPKTKVVITVVKTCVMVVSWLRDFNFEIIASLDYALFKRYSKDITPDIVITTSHKLVGFWFHD